MPNEWHLVHLGCRAVGGAALVFAEATAVSPAGRVTPFDTGMWCEAQAQGFRPITDFVRTHGAVPGIQLSHAGRKASTDAPWSGGRPLARQDGGWQPFAPTAIPFDTGYPVPTPLSVADLDQIVDDFSAATQRSSVAGFEVLEIHMAHGYLLHQFLSPLSNRRTDEYGGDLENRMRLPLRVVKAVRTAWPSEALLFVRISTTDWADGGWDVPQSLELADRLKAIGVDLVDCSSGGLMPRLSVPFGPGYQVPFAAEIRRRVGIATAAVGFITEPEQAEQIVASGQADAVMIGRQFLREPYWPLRAAHALGVDFAWPVQYLRAKAQ